MQRATWPVAKRRGFRPAPPTNNNATQFHQVALLFVESELRGIESPYGTDGGRRRGFREHCSQPPQSERHAGRDMARSKAEGIPSGSTNR